MRRFAFHWAKGGCAVIALTCLAGCGASSPDPGDTLGNLFAYRTPNPPPAPRASATNNNVECPIVQAIEGAAVYRAYAGADRSNASVKVQYALGDVSRECWAENSQLFLRVGVSGYVQAGPVGGPGTFTVPIKITVRRESDQQPAATRSYKVTATIPPGQLSAPFQLIAEPITVPYLSSQADDDYGLYVGFETGAPEKPQRVARRRR